MYLSSSSPYPIELIRRLKESNATESMRVLAAMGWPWARQPILLAGAPRTGTSWTAKMLSLGRNVRYLREPVSHGGHEPASRLRYLEARDRDPEYAAIWRAALAQVTMPSRRWLLGESGRWQRRLPCWPARLLIEEVNCPLALEWLAANFLMRVVVTIRHPCGYVASGLRLRRAGDPVVELDHLLGQPRLIAAHFAEDVAWLGGLADPVARMAAGYGMVYKVLAHQLERHPEWTLVRHEAFCEDPQVEFRRLFDALGIRHTARVDAQLESTGRASDGQLYSLRRRTAEEPEKWKRELTAGQVETVASVIARFRLPFYRDFA